MRMRRLPALGLCVMFLGVTVTASSQDPASNDTAVLDVTVVPHGNPVNIKVLPANITAAEIGKLMKRFEADLGVKCGHCHVEDPNTRKFDYASDEVPAKSSARVMITMLKDINERYLPQLGGDRRYAAQVTCGSCHQGQSTPPQAD